MILKAILMGLKGVIFLIPFQLPTMPQQFQTLLTMLLDGIEDSLGLINAFIDLDFLLSCAAIMLVITNIKHIWNAIIWCLNLFPTIEISYWK